MGDAVFQTIDGKDFIIPRNEIDSTIKWRRGRRPASRFEDGALRNLLTRRPSSVSERLEGPAWKVNPVGTVIYPGQILIMKTCPEGDAAWIQEP